MLESFHWDFDSGWETAAKGAFVGSILKLEIYLLSFRITLLLVWNKANSFTHGGGRINTMSLGIHFVLLPDKGQVDMN